MARGKLIVFNEPASPEVEREYNAWCDGDHLPQILASVPTITGAKRYRIAPGQNSMGGCLLVLRAVAGRLSERARPADLRAQLLKVLRRRRRYFATPTP